MTANPTVQKVVDWIREHPFKSAGIGSLIDLGLVGLMSLLLQSVWPLVIGIGAVALLIGYGVLILTESGLSNY